MYISLNYRMLKPVKWIMEEIIIKKGAWSPEEDQKLNDYVMRFGIWNWNLMPKFAGLSRTGKSCRLRWMNYLRPDVKKGPFTLEEREIVIKMYQQLGNRWSAIAGRLPGRTDNKVKNFFHTHLKKHLGQKNIDAPVKSRARPRPRPRPRPRRAKKKADKAQEKPILFVDISETWSNKSSLMISPEAGSSILSSSSIITFDQNENFDMEKTVILESNPAGTTHHHHHSSSDTFSTIDSFVDTTSFWLHLLNDAHRRIV